MDPSEFNPEIGTSYQLANDVIRITAPNPSPMTFRGTNTYLLGTTDLAVIDPGPESDAHLQAILAALKPDQKITHILITHSHLDHSPLAARLSKQTDAPVYGFGPSGAGQSDIMKSLALGGQLGGGEGFDPDFAPDLILKDKDHITGANWSMQALWTPGHFGNHLCFGDEKRMFCGDHVMGWATSLVSPPDGDLTQFMASCARLLEHPASIYYPGHGAPLETPHERLRWLIAHRQAREAQILDVLNDGVADADMITAKVYLDTPTHLHKMAARNVLSHLVDLTQRNICRPTGPLTAHVKFELIL